MKMIRVAWYCMLIFTSNLDAFAIDIRYKKAEIENLARVFSQRGFLEMLPYFKCSHINHLLNRHIIVDPLRLQEIAKDALLLIRSCEKKASSIKGALGLVAPQSITKRFISLDKVKETLNFVVDCIEEDKKNQVFRILQPKFLKENFGFLKWLPQKKKCHPTILFICPR